MRRLPGEGSCGGLFTANTMSTAIEVMGLSSPAMPLSRVDPRKADESRQAGGP